MSLVTEEMQSADEGWAACEDQQSGASRPPLRPYVQASMKHDVGSDALAGQEGSELASSNESHDSRSVYNQEVGKLVQQEVENENATDQKDQKE